MKKSIFSIAMALYIIFNCGLTSVCAEEYDAQSGYDAEQGTDSNEEKSTDDGQCEEYIATSSDAIDVISEDITPVQEVNDIEVSGENVNPVQEINAIEVSEENVNPVQATVSPSVSYKAHVSKIGWQSEVSSGGIAGTVNAARAIEALQISVSGPEGVGIKYAVHGQDYGWQDWVYDGAVSGTTGRSKRVEAIKIELVGDNASLYDVYYRTHVQNVGWLDWAKNGMVAGSYGLSLRMEALQIVVVEKGAAAPGGTAVPCCHEENINYRVHSQDIGWMDTVSNGATGGVTGRAKRMEAITISIPDLDGVGVKYCTHVQGIGWMDYVYDGSLSGTTGRSKRVEAIKIELTGDNAQNYNVWYRAHVQNVGWMDWVSNGAIAGTTGLSRRLEAIQIKVLPKGLKGPNGAAASAPGSTASGSEASMLAREKLNQIGWDLKKAFDYAAGMTYYRRVSVPPAGKHIEGYATYGLRNHKGNCYVMAATFCQLARELGYECYLVEGYVPKRGGGVTEHGWTEIVVNGKVYVCDPDFTNATDNNGYMITYGTSGTWIYQKYQRVN